MKTLYKKSISIATVLVAISFFQASAMNDSSSGALISKIATHTAVAGSLVSFGCWLPETLAVVSMYGVDGAILSTHIPRLVVDASCAASSAYNVRNTVVNTTCVLGSALSLYMWAPSIIANYNNPAFLARAVIDLLQIGLAVSRVL